jgi:hypothetical protein
MVKRKGVLHRKGGNELVVEHSEQKRNDTMVLAAPQIPFRDSKRPTKSVRTITPEPKLRLSCGAKRISRHLLR